MEFLGHVGGAALHPKASRQLPARPESSGGTFLHGLPDFPDAVAYVLERSPVHFVGEHDEVDWEALVGADAQQFGGATERIENRALGVSGGRLAFFDDEASTDGVIDARVDGLAVSTEGRKPHPILVAREQSVLIKDEISASKGHAAPSKEREQATPSDAFDQTTNFGGIDLVRLFPEESEQYAAIGAMAQAGEGQRTEEFDADLGDPLERFLITKSLGKAIGGSHGTDGVGARGPDSDLEEVKQTCMHP